MGSNESSGGDKSETINDSRMNKARIVIAKNSQGEDDALAAQNPPTLSRVLKLDSISIYSNKKDLQIFLEQIIPSDVPFKLTDYQFTRSRTNANVIFECLNDAMNSYALLKDKYFFDLMLKVEFDTKNDAY
ncbi:hypothetical protein ENBRE01_1275 [Enteropsectra breve]|nr:hypothetical protein ENBRE01_1275 [Enteropsectra breve]